ncbi:MAG TPA: polysaccharide deacetylase family protein [Pirellulaceae bacterium]|nr:polysaccharide deacetylase family protein [Pirellulaceae bacterium]
MQPRHAESMAESISRRTWLKTSLAAATYTLSRSMIDASSARGAESDPGRWPKPEALSLDYAFPKEPRPRLAITLDLEMSAQYPKPGMTEWNYEKGNLDEATKEYSLKAARLVKKAGGVIHFFCVGRVLEQPDVEWLKELAKEGHPIGNHTYDHVNVKATKAEETQFRFQRAPWLVRGKTALEVIRENIRVTTESLEQRCGVKVSGFRTPGGFNNGLSDRPDLQELLLDLGFTWVSSKYPAHATVKAGERPGDEVFASILKAQEAAQPFRYDSGLVEIPMSPISDVTAFRAQKWTLQEFTKAIRMAIDWTVEKKMAFTLLAHPSCLVVEDPDIACNQLLAAGS